MKKMLVAFAILAVAATCASAGVGILWTISYGAYTHDAPNVTDYPSPNNMLGSYSAIWQLIYAGADNIANPLDSQDLGTGAPGIADDYGVAGDDVVWAERIIALGGGAAGDGTSWDEWMVWDGTGDNSYVDLSWATAGFVYQRVFEGTPVANVSYFYQSDLVALNTGFAGGGAPLQDFSLDTGSAGFQPDHVIPEPATMSLLGLGALVMAIRRRRS